MCASIALAGKHCFVFIPHVSVGQHLRNCVLDAHKEKLVEICSWHDCEFALSEDAYNDAQVYCIFLIDALECVKYLKKKKKKFLA